MAATYPTLLGCRRSVGCVSARRSPMTAGGVDYDEIALRSEINAKPSLLLYEQ